LNADGLRREGTRLACYLGAKGLDDGALEHYVRWHGSDAARGDAVDRPLMILAAWGAPGLALADAYAARFRRGSLLRRKLVLVLALMETTAPAFETVDRPLSRGPVGFWVRMTGRSVLAGVLTLAALPLLGPAHLVALLLERGRSSP